MKIKYTGPLKDYSGYGEASRHHVAALHTAGIEVIPELLSYSSESSDFGLLGTMLEPLYQNTGKYNIKLLHTTPNEYRRLAEKDKYNIGFMYWETDKVPNDFAEGLKVCDEIWTGSKANKDAIRKAGVDKPVYIFPQSIETERTWPEPYEIPNAKENAMVFYSIFEWTDRKNPEALLNAYWSEFQNDENVVLLIKTYFRNFSYVNKKMIIHQINSLKKRSGLQKFPPVFVYFDLMDRQQIMRLHQTGDVYVSAHRGEGWGVPQVEAAIAGKPMISTGYSGCHEYFTKGENALLLPYTMTKLRGMDHSDRWYSSDQKWAEVDREALRAAFRSAVEYPDKIKEVGRRAQKFATERFNFKRVGEEMAKRLKEVEAKL